MGERLTLVVFKDHLSSRTLTVRLSWLRAMGLALLCVIALTIIAGGLFFSAYRKTISTGSVANSRRVEELEKETAEIRASYENLKSQTLNSAERGAAPLAGASHSFSLLPAESILEKIPAPESLPFRLETVKAQWKGAVLQIRSAIEYTKDDGGNQQGHFAILVRGPESIDAYPDGVFDAAGSPVLVKPDSGEFFSVSRYREIKADFGPFTRREEVRSIEIYIFDLKKRLIFLSQIGLEAAAQPPVKKVDKNESTPEKPAPRPSAIPSPTPIETGASE